MKIYQISQPSPSSNRIVRELNAAVLSLTFENEGVQDAELWSCAPNSCDVIIAYGTCAPVHATFIKTIKIDFKRSAI